MSSTATKTKPSTNPKKKKKQQQKSAAKKSSAGDATGDSKQKRLATDPPLECSKSDFDSLLVDASGLADYGEASSELIDCARYGEVDAVRAILDVWSPGKSKDGDLPLESGQPARIVDAADASGSTPLHKACANKHSSTARLLLSRGADAHALNDSGNTPLHWAASAGGSDCVGLLLDHADALHSLGRGGRLDVLLKNGFGRSALTEAFASGDTATVQHVLNHDSAEEDRLIGGLDRKDASEGEADEVAEGKSKGAGEKSDDEKGIVHEFDFLRGSEEGEAVDSDERPTVLIRELPIKHADDPFGQAPEDDTTGLGIWCASLVMARWLASPSMVERMAGRRVLELGAGCAIPSLAAAVHGSPAEVIATDLNPETVENIRHNVELNSSTSRAAKLSAATIDWGDESTYPPDPVDYVLCSDCIYQRDIVPLLRKVVSGVLAPGGTFLYVAPDGGRDGLPAFISSMGKNGFERTGGREAPEGYRSNPLRSGDGEDCFLHFHELASTRYVLYEFRKC